MNKLNSGYRSLNAELKRRFGCKVYKLAISGGMTCPNRDGTLGTRGCIFCSKGGSGEFAAKPCGSVAQQIEQAKKLVAEKAGNAKYIAYFQDYTNTYAPVEKLRSLFEQALAVPDVVALSVATRPDCLPNDVIALLAELNRIKPVWVELGLQTVHEKSAAFIRRGYALPCFDEAMRKLKENGIEVIVHLILGLPHETKEQMLQSVDYVAHSGANGIKLQLLHVLKDTDLALLYEKGEFSVMEEDEYIALVAQCLEHLPPNMIVHRLTGDGAKRDLIAPLWSANKKQVLNRLNRYLIQHKIVQGKQYH
ncbi:MAG TPA: TIGR01212 family radical SAM protein [Ruminococcaceae bacterium]|nr:TIGR01212 family radical SAM protein [Oscillospiraceae bacterium]